MSQFVQRYVEALDGWFEFDRSSGEFTDPSVHGHASKSSAQSGPMVMRDLDPYKTAATDIATKGRVIIGGRRQHREFLQRNGYIEVGNEFVPPKREELPSRDRIMDIKRALGE